MAKAMYVGVTKDIPIYEQQGTPVVTPITVITLPQIFSVEQTATTFIDVSEGTITVSSDASAMSNGRGESTCTLTALVDIDDLTISVMRVLTSVVSLTVNNNAITLTDSDSYTFVDCWTGSLATGESISMTGYISADDTQYGAFRITCSPTIIEGEGDVIVGYEQKDVASKAKKAYIGIPTEVPVYEYEETTATVPLSVETITQIFTIESNTDTSIVDTTISGKITISAVSSKYKYFYELRAIQNIESLKIYFMRNTYATSQLIVRDTEITLPETTYDFTECWSGSLNAGDTISFSSYSAVYESHSAFQIECSPTITITEGTIVGYIQKDIARKIKKMYCGVDEVARLFYVAETFGSYTGEYTTSTIEIDGTAYNLYTLLTSGTLSIDDSAQYWMCGGGGAGANSSIGIDGESSSEWMGQQAGGGGGGGYIASGDLPKGNYVIVIGSGGSSNSNGTTTEITNVVTAAGGGCTGTTEGAGCNGANGGSGGGAGYKRASSNAMYPWSAGSAGTGANVSTYPFGITDLKAHCAGGGGGSGKTASGQTAYGYDGGSNGSDGLTISSGGSYGIGGEYGGGNGGALSSAGSAATFYGSGGGGAGFYASGIKTGGAGYQGVVYILLKA